MKRVVLSRFSLLLFLVLLLSSSAFGSSTIEIVNGDSPGVGFNDPTPVSPVGGNQGTTLGQQRLNAFQYAANIWGAILNSNTPIRIRARWIALPCTASGGTIGSAGSNDIVQSFPNAPFANTWYSSALANALSGTDLSPGTHEINASFNVNLGTPGCMEDSHFYLGLDRNHGSGVDLVVVLLHEFGHGLGFQSFTDETNGVWAGPPGGESPSAFDHFLFDNNTSKHWSDSNMTNAERQASAISVNKLAWSGSRVTAEVPNILATPLLRINSPSGIAGNYSVGTAGFGAPLSAAGVTANVVQAIDEVEPEAGSTSTNGCSPLTNAGAISGKIALIDRGNCLFVTKVKNAQNAGAVGVIIVNVTTPGVVQMGGSDPTLTIPTVSVTNTDGNTIKSQLAAPVNATLMVNPSAPSGIDGTGRALLFAPNPVDEGSSVSHWDTTLYPNQLMEPNITGDITHSVVPIWDLTFSLLRDLGWKGNPIGDSQFFVRQQYKDFLNREPDAAGFAFWHREIVNCGIDVPCVDNRRQHVSAAFFLSIEFQETGFMVYRFYKAAFGNLPNNAPVPIRFEEFLPDTQQIGDGVQVGTDPDWEAKLEANIQAFAAAFVARARFLTDYPTSMSPIAFVDQLFSRAGVTPSASDRSAAIAEFGGAGNTADAAARARAVRRVADNSILKAQEKNKAFVLMQYFGYLRRNPYDPPEATLDYTGYNFWLTKLLNHGGDFVSAEMVRSFLVSGEYLRRFGD